MHRKHIVLLVAAGFATSFFALAVPSKSLAAGGNGNQSTANLDTDDDFLPDAVEQVVMSNANAADTDGDQIPDFIEVVAGGQPRHESSPLPLDQEMRVVITGSTPGGFDDRAP